jgi:acyl dehydratase
MGFLSLDEVPLAPLSVFIACSDQACGATKGVLVGDELRFKNFLPPGSRLFHAGLLLS